MQGLGVTGKGKKGRGKGATVRIAPDLAILLHKKMEERNLNFFRLADVSGSHHSTISRVLGPDEGSREWRLKRDVMEATLYRILKALEVPSEDVHAHIEDVAKKTRKLDKEERRLLQAFRDFREHRPGEIMEVIEDLERRTQDAKDYDVRHRKAHARHGAIPPTEDP